jgi:signal transduction histidine kinase
MQPGRQVVIEADGPTHAVFDAALIRRVVENLVSNGFKHTPRDRPLRIRIEHIDEPRVSVRDEGQGIPAEFREVIFDKYGTAQARDEGAYHSVGLGLAFCKLAVRAHGGRIGVESEVGVGSEFWFSLPNRTEPS